MNKVLLILLSCISLQSFGQNKFEYTEEPFTCKSSFNSVQLNSSSQEDVFKFCMKQLAGLDEHSFRLSNLASSKTSKHYMLKQTYMGIPITGKFMKVNCRKDGMVQSTFRNLSGAVSISGEQFPDSEETRNQLLKNFSHTLQIKEFRKVYYESNGVLHAAAEVYCMPTHGEFRQIIIVNNEVVYDRDLIEHFDGDTTIKVKVFQPDPLTTSGNVYGGVYVDNNDLDASSLNNERVQDTCIGNHNGTNFELYNSFVVIQEHSPPVTVIPTPSADSFFFQRSQSGFEDANAFYHITRFKQHVNGLGYTNLLNYQIRVDAHGLNGADNSTFNAAPFPPELTFGEGGVDDAEDADVIVHEYGHSLSFDAAPNTNTGTERRNLEEANSDYLATSYSRNINPFSWENVYTWDGHNQYWAGRSAITTKNYQTISFSGNIYEHTDLWCGTLMELWGDLGRQVNDEILIESIFGYAPGMSMQDAAALFVQADSNLNAGANYWKICPRFFNRGLLSTCTTLGSSESQIFNSFGIESSIGSNQITVHQFDQEDWKLTVIDIQGRIVLSHNVTGHQLSKKIEIPNNGLFLIECVNSKTKKVFKTLIINK